MRHYGSRKRIRRTSSRPRIQHSPSEMGGSIAANVLAVTRFLCTPNRDAGTSATLERSGSDRATEVDNGSIVGQITLNVSLQGATSSGILEIGIVKYERQFTTPAQGVDPNPSTADVLGAGLQQIMRINTPGWVLQYHEVPFTAETTRSKILKINLGRFRKSKWRDGDYLALHLFNRTASTSLVVNHSARYYEYK